MHQDFKSDLAKLKRLEMYTPLWFLVGACFAGIIFNPNYTSRHSFYLRKFTPLFFGVIGVQWSRTQQGSHVSRMLMKNNDYLPLEVKRTLQDKDFRHMVHFNYVTPSRQLWCEVSGKSLS